jgi:AcrR family transcriptional regulator
VEEMPRVAPEVRRQAIMDAALQLFQEHGFDAVRVDDILEKTGLSKGGFYHHFKSREDILRQLVAEEISATVAATDKNGSLVSDDPLTALIELFLRGSSSLGAEQGVLATLGSFASKSVYLDELERQLSLQLKPLIANIIDSGINKKLFRKVDSAANAEIVMAVNDHGNRCAVLGSLDREQLRAYNRTAIEILGRQLGIEEQMQDLLTRFDKNNPEQEGE